MAAKHDWQVQLFYDKFVGHVCSKCDAFFEYYNPRPMYGCVEDYSTMSQQDIRRELSGTEFWNEEKGDR